MNTSRQGTRVLTVFDEHGAVHDGVGNALRPLADTPAVVGEVMHDVFRQWLHCIGIKYGEIRRHTRTYQPAVIDTKRRSRDEGELTDGFFEGQDLLLTHPIAQQTRAKADTAVELYVRTAIGEPHNRVGTGEQGGHSLGIDVDFTKDKDRIEVFGHGQIEEGIKYILALRRRNLSDTFTFQSLMLRQLGCFDHHEIPAFREHSLGAQGAFDIGPELLAHNGVTVGPELLCVCSQEDGMPVRHTTEYLTIVHGEALLDRVG